jgi:hypothetical protein
MGRFDVFYRFAVVDRWNEVRAQKTLSRFGIKMKVTTFGVRYSLQ